ncbi:hypothetical protein, partial [Escherichia coli]|uniref:hypothetical protein n=1 Tax=Escherichia coli TaxID=562 RepID=UPI003AF3B9ED
MNDISSDDIFLLKQRLAEQEALIHALQEKLSNRDEPLYPRLHFGPKSVFPVKRTKALVI